MIQILSFRSRAQISQLIEETANQITNKNSLRKYSMRTVCLGGMSNIRIDFLKMNEKKIYFYLTSVD